MPVGHCPFCKRDGMKLEDSHYLSKGVYKGFRAEELANPNPILITGARMLQSSQQIHEFCLCWDCEQIFNKSGENWTVPRLGWQGKGFEVWKLVKTAPYLPTDEDLRTYGCDHVAEMDCASVAHFGLGIFWKGHAHEPVESTGYKRGRNRVFVHFAEPTQQGWKSQLSGKCVNQDLAEEATLQKTKTATMASSPGRRRERRMPLWARAR